MARDLAPGETDPYASPLGGPAQINPDATLHASETSAALKWKLFIMMMLEFFIWGAWLPLAYGYMGSIGFTGTQQAWIGSAFAIAAIVGIFFSNQWADRTFSAERFLSASHLIGGLAIGGLFFTRSFWPFFTLMLIHSLCYVPTISVANSLAFANLRNPTRDFGLIRMGGTIGWVLAAWPLFFILSGSVGEESIRGRSMIFLVSGGASLALAAYALTLPHTPPKRGSGEILDRFAWLKAFWMLGTPFLLVLFIVTFIDSTIHNGYFLLADPFLRQIGIPAEWVMPVMSIGQVTEILTMLILGYALVRLGWRVTMIIGILGHAARFAIFAFFPDNVPLIVAVQALHGICYAFYFATVYIFIDRAFPSDIRSSAQGLFNLLILGLGDLAAKWLFLPMKDSLTDVNGQTDFSQLFLIPTGMALLAAVILAVAFWPRKDLEVSEVSAV